MKYFDGVIFQLAGGLKWLDRRRDGCLRALGRANFWQMEFLQYQAKPCDPCEPTL